MSKRRGLSEAFQNRGLPGWGGGRRAPVGILVKEAGGQIHVIIV